jgi:hypothetical protein
MDPMQLIDQEIAAHQSAMDALRALRTKFEAALKSAPAAATPIPTAAPAPAPAPAVARATATYPLPQVAHTRPAAPAPAPAPARPVVRRPPGRPPKHRMPPPPPGLSIRDRMIEQLQAGPRTSAEIIQATGLIGESVYSSLKHLKNGGIVEVITDPADGFRKYQLRQMPQAAREMAAVEAMEGVA